MWCTDRQRIYQNAHWWQIESWGILTFMYLIGKWFTFVILKCTRRTILEIITQTCQGLQFEIHIQHKELYHSMFSILSLYYMKIWLIFYPERVSLYILIQLYISIYCLKSDYLRLSHCVSSLYLVSNPSLSDMFVGVWCDLHVLMKNLGI